MVVEIAADHSCWNDENVTCAQVNLSKGEHMQAGGSENDDDDFGLGDVFPEQIRPPSPPNDVSYYTRPDGARLAIRLVNKHPLWGHVLYPTSKCLATFLADNAKEYIEGKRVLELGAGGGLPSLISALEGSKKTIVTDFPDPDLIRNIKHNIETNIPLHLPSKIVAEGYTWGTKTDNLIALNNGQPFDTILAADLVFNHSQHSALLKTCQLALAGSTSPAVLLFYSHHRPTTELIAKDRAFVALAEQEGWTAVKVLEDINAGPAFPEDGGDLAIRSTVHGFRLQPPQ
ncbi:Protein N-terminal and lysine N-methyltransferase efm7 [Cystobasidiomycetes sp. EMM_F5]